MIPKRMIFIWLGKNPVPEYGKHAMEVFREVNPDFELMFVHEPDIENTKNEDLKECLRMMESSEYNICRHMVERKFAKNHFSGDSGRIVGLSDAFRMFLLNKYGGIYLDLDTFPVKPFDEKLLSYGNFAVNHIQKRFDYFFLGFEPGCVDRGSIIPRITGVGQIFNRKLVKKIKYPEEMVVGSPRFKRNKKLLVDCGLKYGDAVLKKDFFPDYYIDHYRLGSWMT